MPAIAGFLFVALALRVTAEDWPMWRHDPGRAAYSGERLPERMELHWVREYAPRVAVWDDPLNHDLMPYDKVFEPVVLGDRMFVSFNDSDKVVALDIRSGGEVWRFYTDGPVRLPPVAWRERVYFTSDDGHLYCVGAGDGRLLWKFLGGPSLRKAIGNRRVISAWPARGGPVIRDGVVYFAASIWPFMGTFIYALDARTGEVQWVNDGTGAQFIKQPHSADAFAGVAPQGALVATGDMLLVPGGRSVPAAFDRRTGEFRYFHINDGGKGVGGSVVMADDQKFFVHTRGRGVREFELKTGKKDRLSLNEPVLGRGHYYTGQEHSDLQQEVVEAREKIETARYAESKARSELREATDLGSESGMKKADEAIASALKKLRAAEAELAKELEDLGTNYAGRMVQAFTHDRKVEWEIPADATGDLIKAGGWLYAAGADAIVAIAPPQGGAPARIAWSHPVEGTVARLLAANGMLFAVTLEGRILAFGAGTREAARLKDAVEPLGAERAVSARARELMEATEARAGYALWFGVGDGELLEGVVASSELQVVAVEGDVDRVSGLRRRWDRAGLYGRRVTVHAGDPVGFKAPPYIAHLVVVGESWAAMLSDARAREAIYQSVRPYGGTLWVDCKPGAVAGLTAELEAARLPRARVIAEANGIRVVREGALPGSADWTHQYGDIGNRVKSDDATVKLPLGVLWFGGNSNLDVLPRHGHGPSEQVVGGRLFIQGMASLSARDVYTGRVLWKAEMPDLGTEGVYYDESYLDAPLSTLYNQRHIPGANARGANYVSTADEVYVAVGNGCRVLSAKTGEVLRTIAMPAGAGEEAGPDWAYIGVYGDIVFGGSGFANYSQRYGSGRDFRLPSLYDLSGSAGLVAFDRRTGAVRWRVAAKYSFLNNGIVAGKGRVYCLDRLPKSAEDKLKRRGGERPEDYRVVAFEAETGRELWVQTNTVFGTWLGYSAEHDLLLQAGASATDRSKDEVGQGMATLRGADGVVVWKNDLRYNGPCILHNDVVITTPPSNNRSSGAFNLRDGTPHLITNPLTGKTEPWRIYRTYGCNTPIASEHLLTFRSGAAGFYDLETHGGTGNFGGFKSGCTPNLVVANGVLNAPDYTRTCSCAYQNQTSLAFVHMPELEVWTYNLFGADPAEHQRIRRVGINLGAPGDRRSEAGTLWIDHPSVGGSSAKFDIAMAGEGLDYFRRHASQVGGEGVPWVIASGVRNVASICVTPELQKPAPPAPAKSSKDDDDEEEENGNGQNGGKVAGSGGSAGGQAAAEPEGLSPVPYTVRLYFAEPDAVEPGGRVFSVAVQGREVVERLDIAAETGGRYRGLIKTFKDVMVSGEMSIAFKRAPGSAHGPVLCGVELIAQENRPYALGTE